MLLYESKAFQVRKQQVQSPEVRMNLEGSMYGKEANDDGKRN